MSQDREWMTDAVCATTDPSLFFPQVGDNAYGARLICGSCPVAEQCLTYAIENEFNEGIFGGLTPNERRKLATRKPPKMDRYMDRIRSLHARGLNDSQIGAELRIPRTSVRKWREAVNLPSNWRAS